MDGSEAAVTLDSSLMFLNGARSVEVVDAVAREPENPATLLFEAEDGRLGPGWSIADKDAYSGGRYANLWADDAPVEGDYFVEMDVEIPTAGRYAVFFSGNPLTRLAAPRSLSPFTWAFDEDAVHEVHRPIQAAPDIMNAGDGLFRLGEVELGAGKHRFALRIKERRETPDTHYALSFDALVLHRLRPRKSTAPNQEAKP